MNVPQVALDNFTTDAMDVFSALKRKGSLPGWFNAQISRGNLIQDIHYTVINERPLKVMLTEEVAMYLLEVSDIVLPIPFTTKLKYVNRGMWSTEAWELFGFPTHHKFHTRIRNNLKALDPEFVMLKDPNSKRSRYWLPEDSLNKLINKYMIALVKDVPNDPPEPDYEDTVLDNQAKIIQFERARNMGESFRKAMTTDIPETSHRDDIPGGNLIKEVEEQVHREMYLSILRTKDVIKMYALVSGISAGASLGCLLVSAYLFLQ